MKKEYSDDLKLIYVLKIGQNTKGEGVYEFIFSEDETNIDAENWRWDLDPACDNAEPPEDEYVDATIELKIKEFNLECLHESVHMDYMKGYNNIIALAYEKEPEEDDEDGFNQYEEMYDNDEDTPLLVFHYGMSLGRVKELFYDRKIILRGNKFVHSSTAEFD